MNVLVPSIPKRLQITQTMVEDFIRDPVLGAYVLLGVKLDVFQQQRLRLLWWVPDVMDCSGFGTGKSYTLWVFINLRAMLIPEQHLVVYYQTFQALKDIFWPYYKEHGARRAPMFAAQLGRLDGSGDVDGKDNTKGPACYQQHFKNGSIVFGPAPGWMQDAKTQAGLTFNVAAIDEWTKVETMTSKDSAEGGINAQILGRVRKSSFNQHHPFWGNHRVFLATAESHNHPGYARYKVFEREVAAGNPNFAIFTSCFKDFSNVPMETEIRVERAAKMADGKSQMAEGRLVSKAGRAFRDVVPNWSTISVMQKSKSRASYKREVLGLWARETRGFYPDTVLEAATAAGTALGLQPEMGRCE